MEKIITIDGRDIKFKSTGATLLRYKAQFRRDALQDIFKIEKAFNKETNEIEIDKFDLEVFYNLIWTLAKTANNDIGDPITWLDTFSEFPLMDIIPQTMDLLMATIKPTVNSKKK
ncbi:MAG: hypothetical protein CVU95_08280 [Firmicutes bacterium HGW-Firmicutes-2]|jgi:hypothetical protein|nr:MAG: hypothetical protein CVU95_08280 [Firmicutes bacterium HGW-Firmicutes-2]